MKSEQPVVQTSLDGVIVMETPLMYVVYAEEMESRMERARTQTTPPIVTSTQNSVTIVMARALMT